MNALMSEARRTARAPSVGTWTPALIASLAVFLVSGTWWGLMTVPLLSGFLRGFLVELCLLGLAHVFHSVAYARGWTGAGTRAGLSLAAYACVARAHWEVWLRWSGFDTFASVYDSNSPLPSPVWHVRNLGALAFAYGLAIMVFSVLRDAHLRRRHPAWVTALED
jgi:hypothetical protein